MSKIYPPICCRKEMREVCIIEHRKFKGETRNEVGGEIFVRLYQCGKCKTVEEGIDKHYDNE